MSTYSTITYETPEEGIGVLTLNRPERLNAISWTMVEEIHACLSALEEDLGTRVLILTGAGRGFCSGTDLKGEKSDDSGEVGVAKHYKRQRSIGDIVLHMRKIPQPIVCAVNGVAAGGGFSFAMATDIRVAAKSARFICSFINVGLTGGDVGSSYFMPRLFGLSRAADLVYTGRAMDAEEACRVGFVSQVVEEDKVMDASLEYARTMLGKSPFGLRLTKEIFNHSIDAPSLEAALYMENRSQVLAVQTGDFRVAAKAFEEKRAPVYPKET